MIDELIIFNENHYLSISIILFLFLFRSVFKTTFILKVLFYSVSRAPGVSYLEKRGILIPVVVLLPGVFPWYPEDALLVVLPHQTGILPAVHLLDQPLAQLSVPAAPGASVVQLEVHLCPKHTRKKSAVRGPVTQCHVSHVKNKLVSKSVKSPTRPSARLTCETCQV